MQHVQNKKNHASYFAAIDIKKKNIQLDLKFYQKPKCCGVSQFVPKLKPEELKINSDSIHEVKLVNFLESGLLRELCEGEFHGRKAALKKLCSN